MYVDYRPIKKKKPVIMLVPTNAGMAGERIETINDVMKHFVDFLNRCNSEEAESDYQLAVLSYHSKVKWVHELNTDVAIEWEDLEEDLEAGGINCLGAALTELDKKLSRYGEGFLTDSIGYYRPIIVLIMNEYPSDDWHAALNHLSGNRWFRHSIKFALNIGNNSDQSVLTAFTGDHEAVFSDLTVWKIEMVLEQLSAVVSCGNLRSRDIGSMPWEALFPDKEYSISKDSNEDPPKTEPICLDRNTPPNTVVYTSDNTPITILQFLAEGGQGYVFKVQYKGEVKVLKWYKPGSIKIENMQMFYNNLCNNVKHGSPNPCFLWPLAMTERIGNSFGFVMDLKPDGYYELADFRLANVQFASLKVGVEACLRLCNALRVLHNDGYCFQNLYDGNVFINPQTGDVRICDCENVIPNKTKTFVMGTPRFMAPEVVLGREQPNTQSDRFSLSVLLFLILFGNHPLEGKLYLCPILTQENEMVLYGKSPLFIFDPVNEQNRPDSTIHQNVLSRWPYVPQYVRDIFLKAFGYEALHNPQKRVRETEWVKLLARFEHDITYCPHCGNEVYILDPAGTTSCDVCGEPVKTVNTICLPEYATAAVNGNRIYRIQLGLCNDDETLDEIARIVKYPEQPDVLWCMNKTTETWTVQSPQGKRMVTPKEVIAVEAGVIVTTADGRTFSFS